MKGGHGGATVRRRALVFVAAPMASARIVTQVESQTPLCLWRNEMASSCPMCVAKNTTPPRGDIGRKAYCMILTEDVTV